MKSSLIVPLRYLFFMSNNHMKLLLKVIYQFARKQRINTDVQNLTIDSVKQQAQKFEIVCKKLEKNVLAIRNYCEKTFYGKH